MKFSLFFNEWLHENYYKNAVNIGKKGDFFTAVSIGELFGTLLAKHFLNLLDKQILKLPIQIVEVGANEGFLSKDFLTALLSFRAEIFEKLEFFIIEPHEKLRTLQKNTLQGVEFSHKTSLKECNFKNAFIFTNELFDSFACELINDGKMAFVKDFEIYFKHITKELKKECDLLGLKKGEFCPYLAEFFDDLNKACENFVFAGFDYGKNEINNFSLRIFKKHEIFDFFSSDLRKFFGKSDLTYDINFKHLLSLIERQNFKLLAFERQSKALLNFGFEELLTFTKEKNQKAYESFLKQGKNLFFNFNDKFHFFEFKK